MTLTRCFCGHFYDKDKFFQCPHCDCADRNNSSTVTLLQGRNLVTKQTRLITDSHNNQAEAFSEISLQDAVKDAYISAVKPMAHDDGATVSDYNYCGYIHGNCAEELNHLYPGTILNGRYIIGQALGFGGFGIIYKVWDMHLNTVLAIKEYYPSGLVNRIPGTKDVILFTNKRKREYIHGMKRFLDEAKRMAWFSSHKSIINVFDYFEENDTAYIVMEYLEGLTMSTFLKRGRLDVNDSITIILRICEALKDIHAAGIVHRDVSPDNIFLCINDTIKLIDFGAARFYAKEDTQMTIILKPGFAPPEQYESVNIQGPWTDIYALGATLYLMATGVKPEESTDRKIDDKLIPPIELNDKIPEYLNNTIMKAMAIDRRLRFASIADFEKALKNEKKVLPTAKERKRRLRRKLAAALTSGLAIFLAVFVLIHVLPPPPPEAEISFWYPLSGDIGIDTAKDEAYAAIIAEYKKSFDKVEVVIKAFPRETYVASIQEAIENGKAPTLFESTGIDCNILQSAVDLNSIVKLLSSEQFMDTQPCYFFDRYSDYFCNKNQIPLGFIAPAIYLNTTHMSYEEDGVSDIGVFGSQELILKSSDRQAFVTAYDHEPVTVSDDAKEAFLADKAAAYFSDTTEYFDVQKVMPARYKLLRVDGEHIYGTLSDLWSIGDCYGDERRAAEALLVFMLSDYSQDYLYIRNRSGTLPINRNILGLYCDVYKDFEKFFKNISEYNFNPLN